MLPLHHPRWVVSKVVGSLSRKNSFLGIPSGRSGARGVLPQHQPCVAAVQGSVPHSMLRMATPDEVSRS